MYTSTHTHMYTSTHTHMYTSTHTHMYTSTLLLTDQADSPSQNLLPLCRTAQLVPQWCLPQQLLDMVREYFHFQCANLFYSSPSLSPHLILSPPSLPTFSCSFLPAVAMQLKTPDRAVNQSACEYAALSWACIPYFWFIDFHWHPLRAWVRGMLKQNQKRRERLA